MQLVAYYIASYKYGIERQTVNFGGKYFYALRKNRQKKIVISRIPNSKYIPNFYSAENLTLVSAIVGGNGSGKTSLFIDMVETI